MVVSMATFRKGNIRENKILKPLVQDSEPSLPGQNGHRMFATIC